MVTTNCSKHYKKQDSIRWYHIVAKVITMDLDTKVWIQGASKISHQSLQLEIDVNDRFSHRQKKCNDCAYNVHLAASTSEEQAHVCVCARIHPRPKSARHA